MNARCFFAIQIAFVLRTTMRSEKHEQIQPEVRAGGNGRLAGAGDSEFRFRHADGASVPPFPVHVS